MRAIRVLFFMVFSFQSFAQTPRTLKRYFGMHFDFHATENDTTIGKNLSEKSLDSLLTAIKPDFIQVDCKGHPGISSYPSKVPTATHARNIKGDPLAFYRSITQKHGVDLYLHYSGVFDVAAIEKHPNWAVVKADGSIDKSKTSVYGPYADSLLVPQLNELASYGANGVWVDGECWATILDYSPTALQRFREETGITTIPRSSKDAGYEAFREFARRSFVRYLGRYVDTIHQKHPTFRIASNWAYSSMMPEPITTHVDYLSGDLTPGNSVNSAALEGRILAAQSQLYKKPWDIMSWSFWYSFNPNRQGDQKTAIHLMQDAAQILSLGGGFQAYYQQSNTAAIPLRYLPVMTELSRFVRARQPFCEGTTPIPQVAVVYANTTVRAFNQSLFGNGQTQRINGVLTALLDAQLPVEVLSEQHLQGRMNQYPLIVLSQQDSLSPAFRHDLLDYAQQGGHLLIMGARTTQQFATELGVTAGPIQSTSSPKTILMNGKTLMLSGPFLPVRLASKAAQPIGKFLASEANELVNGVVASEIPWGKGKLTAIYADISADYRIHQSTGLRDFIAALAKPLLPNPLVEVRGSHLVHVVLGQQHNRLTVNLINTGGRHADPQVFTYDEVPPLTNLQVRIRTDHQPKRVLQQPENKQLAVRYANGIATVIVPQLTIHSVVVLD
ncbi:MULTISPECIES: alpha-amylase family protein [unclassified Spirosoma]|uniref:alpha-amylase family protein n=1 Tax=unclassified Spirosoma TaxID=2621999 RepID=UPI00095ED67B|nr:MULTISPECIES: alpha-amylase family protein [unclassified Spirosoma]MBN8826164.1 hypothetical protein [Spirosoma sp.]OJW76937.1 MAG: hypothetical protein BGO59_22195 [Spirosoma sp. 48-14]